MVLDRVLDLSLPPGQSAFLWGPRKTGKTTLLRQAFPASPVIDLLQTDRFFELSREPSRLREEIQALPEETRRGPVIIDEVQKVPRLLDEVHWLIENLGTSFVLSGSSARKVRRGQANLLGGRAWRLELFPLVYPELPGFDLLRILNRGLLPAHYLEPHFRRSLRAYTLDYLKEEVFDEGLTRNVPAFSRFFESVGYTHGELVNYSNIARDCGVDSKTVREYFQILVDTLLGTWVPPYRRRQERNVIQKASKFYLFDVGVAGAISGRRLSAAKGAEFGKAFEHFVLMELRAHSAYRELDYPIGFWRTKSGQEVDLVLGQGEVAIKVKGASRVDPRDLRSIESFRDQHQPRLSIVVCNEPRARVRNGIRILPVERFLEELWSGKIVA